MILGAAALLLGMQAADAAPPPPIAVIDSCAQEHGDSYAVFACLGQEPGFTQETYERCNAAMAAREAASGEEGDSLAYFEAEREYTRCLGVFSAQFSPIDEVVEKLPELYPLDYYTAALRLFHEEDRKEEALFWMYAGQLRWRARLECHPPEPGGEGALFGAMNAMVGEIVNDYAAENIDLWLETIDKVLAWDAANPSLFAPQTAATCASALANQRRQLGQFREFVAENGSAIKETAGRVVEDTTPSDPREVPGN